jgi:hypothetical protein
MGRTERVCNICKEAYSEYDDHECCTECDAWICEGCASWTITVYPALGNICRDCDNIGGPTAPKKRELLDFVCNKYKVELQELVDEWAKDQPSRNCPCFVCETENCTFAYHNTVELTKEQAEELELCEREDYFGKCCLCAKTEEKCEACSEKTNKKIKIAAE